MTVLAGADAGSRPARQARGMVAWRSRPALLPAIVMLCVLAACIPVLASRPAKMTSDESLYEAEAFNIAHGKGFTYPSGEPITHRAPLYPLILAPAVKAAGTDGAYAVTRVIVVINALLLALLAWRMGGAMAGAIAGVAAASSSYLSRLGASLYLDPAQCAFLLLTLLALHESRRRRTGAWFAAAGLCAGLAFLVKESAVQWAPLGVGAWLAIPELRNRPGARGALLYSLAFVAVVAPWWLWVWVQTSQMFMLGAADARSLGLVAAAMLGAALFASGVAAWPRLPAGARRHAERAATPALIALCAAWGAFMLEGLTRYSSWGYPTDYATTIPRYMRYVAPAAQPYFLLLAAWGWIAARAWQSDGASRLAAVAALLFAPFAVFIANRGLQLRDALPLIYLSYLALGLAVADGIARLRRATNGPAGRVLLLATPALMLAGFSLQQALAFRGENRRASADVVSAAAWHNEFERGLAGWMAGHLPAGAHVLSSRLYFSSLHVDTGGAFEVRQMPTVRVDIDPSVRRMLIPRANLFRWGDETLRPYHADDQWLWLRQFPGKAYWIGLSQQELLEYVAAHDIDYVVLTGDDGTFSSLAYADWFAAHPAFRLLTSEARSPSQGYAVFAVDRSQLATVAHATVISPSSMAALSARTGLDAAGLAAAVGAPIRVTDLDAGRSPRERAASGSQD
jgi:4-amino-4-deoxy-L-arabinose transferase-like glycosyltransferase